MHRNDWGRAGWSASEVCISSGIMTFFIFSYADSPKIDLPAWKQSKSFISLSSLVRILYLTCNGHRNIMVLLSLRTLTAYILKKSSSTFQTR